MNATSQIVVAAGSPPQFNSHRGLLQSRHKYVKVSEDGENTTYAVMRPRQTLADRALQFISLFCFWRVSAAKATQIVMQHTGRPRECIRLYSTLQERWFLYCYWKQTDCWYAEVDIGAEYVTAIGGKPGAKDLRLLGDPEDALLVDDQPHVVPLDQRARLIQIAEFKAPLGDDNELAKVQQILAELLREGE